MVLTTERCERTDLLVRDCAHCKKLPDPERVKPAVGDWFDARFPGRCSRCQTDFDPGDEIRADGEGGYLAACCGEDED